MKSGWEDIEEQKLWDDSLLEKPEATFLQAFAFGQFHRKLGNQTWHLGLRQGNRLVSFCLVVKLKSKVGSFLYVPGGPILENWEEDFPKLVSQLQLVGKKVGVSCVRFDPRVLTNRELLLLKNLGLKEAPFYTQPACTQILNLKQDLEAIKSGFSSSTRYNIGWVARQGVEVRVSSNAADIGTFVQLLQETAVRHRFRLTGNISYYQEQFLSFLRAGQGKLYLSFAPSNLGNKLLAAAVVIYFGRTATYLHAASSSSHPKLRAPYLMQWKIIEDAKKANIEVYDFWGISSNNNPRDPWAGVSMFKRGFGGEKICYFKPYDLVINNSYYFFNLAERTRSLIKKLPFYG